MNTSHLQAKHLHVALACIAVACGGRTAADTSTKTAQADERVQRVARVQKARVRDQEADRKERDRWTDALRHSTRALVERDHPNTRSFLEAIIASPHRIPGRDRRDASRHPVDTLAFLGIQPDMTVIEAGAGTGWYSEILGPLLAKRGKLVILSFDPEGPEDAFTRILGLRVRDFMTRAPEIFGTAELRVVDPPGRLVLGPPGSADMVLAFREMHNWHRRGYLADYLAAIHVVLRPGGILGVVQHRAPANANPDDSANSGYLPQDWVIARAEEAGLRLEASSEINANPKDTKDYDRGVWTLPPTFAKGSEQRARYQAIGESDRMTLKFIKPAE